MNLKNVPSWAAFISKSIVNGTDVVGGCLHFSMKTAHALNFFLVGLGMCCAPACWPDFFASSANGNDASALWLQMMGITQAAMGAWAMTMNLVPRWVLFLIEWEPVNLVVAAPDVGWSLPDTFYAGLQDDEEIRRALSLQQQLRFGAAA